MCSMVNMWFDVLDVLIVANKGLDMYPETLFLKSPWLIGQQFSTNHFKHGLNKVLDWNG